MSDEILTMEAKAALHAAADLLEETGWTTAALARDANGLPTSPFAEDAACFCLIGAIRRATHYGPENRRSHDDNIVPIRVRAKQLIEAKIMMQIPQWNDVDCPDKAAAIAMLRKAAE